MRSHANIVRRALEDHRSGKLSTRDLRAVLAFARELRKIRRVIAGRELVRAARNWIRAWLP